MINIQDSRFADQAVKLLDAGDIQMFVVFCLFLLSYRLIVTLLILLIVLVTLVLVTLVVLVVLVVVVSGCLVVIVSRYYYRQYIVH